MNDDLLTIEQAAKVLNVSTKTMRRWDMTGKLSPKRTVGNHRRYTRSEVEAYMQQRTGESASVTNPVGVSVSPTPAGISTLLSSAAAEAESETVQPVEDENDDGPEIVVEDENAPHLPTTRFSRRSIVMAMTGLVSMLFMLVVAIFTVPHSQMFAQAREQVMSVFPGGQAAVVTDSSSPALALRSKDGKLAVYNFNVNVPAVFGKKTTFLDDVEIKKSLTVDGKLKAPNIVYSLVAGQNVSITGDPQHPTISAGTTGGVSSFQGQTGAVALTAGSGLSVNGLEISNTGVLSVQDQTGNVQFSGGIGISLSGLTINNTDGGSAQNIFKNFTVDGANTIVAGSNDDTINFAAGSGITLTGDPGSKTITIAGGGGGLSGMTTNGVLYASSSTSVLTTSPPGAGQVLLGNTSGVPTFTALSGDLGVDGNGVVTILPDSIALGTDTTGNYQLGTVAGNGVTVTGTAAEGWSPVIGINLATSGTSSSTNSNSGLETSSDGLSLLRGCGNGQILKWNSVSGKWECNNDSGGGGGSGGIANVNGNGYASSDSTTLNFSNEFALTESPATQSNVAIDYTNSHITRDNQNQTISGLWNFTNRIGIGTVSPTAMLDVQGSYGSNAAAIINQKNSGNIFAASASGATKFVIANNGDLAATGALSGLTGLSSSGTITFSGLGSGVVHSSSGVLSSSQVTNGELQNSSVTINTGTGLSGGGTLSLGGTLNLANAGVTTLTGTANQIAVSGATGAVTLSLPQDIATSSSPTFNGLTVSSLTAGTDTITDFTGTGLQVVGNALQTTLGTSVDLASEVNGVLGTTNGGTGLNSYATGDLLYASASNTLAARSIGSSGQILTVSGGLPTWMDAGGIINFWQRANGAVAPFNITDDLLLGSTATSSAKFRVSGTTGDASSAGNLTFNSAASVQTTSNQTLTFGGNTTGNIVFSPLNGSGTVTINGDLNLASGKVFQINGSNVLTTTTLGSSVVNSSLTSVGTLSSGSISSGFGNIDVGSDSIGGGDFTSVGTTGFTSSGSGAGLTFSGTGNHDITASGGTLRLGPTTLNGAITGNNQSVTGLNNLSAAGTITFSTFSANGGVLYTNASGVLAQAAAGGATQVLHGGATPGYSAVALGTDVSGTLPIGNGGTNTGSIGSAGSIAYSTGTAYGFSSVGTAGQVLLSGGAGVPTWVDSSALGTNYLQRNLGVLSPLAITDDFAIGGTATSSAKFQVFGLNGNATTSGTLTFNTAGVVQTTNNQTLTFGGNSTGNIVFSPQNGAGTVTVNGNMNLASGDIYQINGTSVLSNNTLGSGVLTSSLTTVGALASGSIANGFGTIATANSISGSTLGIAGTTVVDNSRNAVNLANITASGTITFSGLGAGIAHVSSGGVVSSSAVGLGSADVSGTLGIGNGGTGLGSTPTNGQLLIGNGSGYSLATITQGSGIGVSNGSGTISISNTGVLSLAGTANQISVSGATGAITLSLPQDIAAASSPTFASLNLTNNTNQLILGTSNTATITMATLTTGRTYTLPDATGTICLSTGNCAGAGTSVTTLGGTTNRLAKFTGSQAIGNASINDLYNSVALTIDASGNVGIGNVTPGAVLDIAGGNTGGNAAAIVNQTGAGTNNIFAASSSGTTQFVIANNGDIEFTGGSGFLQNVTSSALASKTYNFPDFVGSSADVCLSTGNCSGSGGGLTGSGANGQLAFFTGTSTIASDTSLFFNSTNKLFGIGNATPVAKLDVFGAVKGKALSIFNETGDQNILVGSASGTTRFAFDRTGNLNLTGGGYQIGGTTVIDSSRNIGNTVNLTASGTITLSGLGQGIAHLSSGGVISSSAIDLATGDITGTLGTTHGGTGLTSYTSGDLIYGSGTNTLSTLAKGADGQILSLVSGLPSWISSSTINFWQRANGSVAPLNITDDLLLGSTATSSAKFRISGTTGDASSAGNLTFNSAATVQTTNNQTLTFGGNSTGNIVFSPLNGSGTVSVNGIMNLATGNVYQINGTSVLSNNTLGTGVTTSSLTTVGALASGSIASGFGTIATNNSISGSTLGIGGTTVIDNSRNIGTVVNLTASGTITFSGLGAGVGHLSAGGVLTSSAVALGGSEVTGTLSAGNGGTGQTTYAQGDLLYGNGGGGLSKLTLGGPLQYLTASGGNLVWTDANGSINFWQRANGVLSPLAITDDLAVGGTATSSAKFQVFGNTGNATTSGTLTFNTAGNIQTTNNQTLTLGGASTGNIVFSPLNGSGTVTVNGTMNLATGNVYQINGTSVLSNNTLGSGVTTSSLTTVGALASGSIAAGFGTIATNNSISGSTLGISGTTVIDASRNLTSIVGVATSLNPTAANTDDLGTGTGNQYRNIYGQTIYQGGNQVCDASGNCSGLTVTYWNQTNGAVYTKNSTVDLLLGSNATASARFAVTNINSGTPTASLSAGTNGGAYITADGFIQTTANQSLTIGGSTTGNITLSPQNGSGTVVSTGDLSLSSGKSYKINGASVLSATVLGSSVVGSSLTSVGALASGSIASGFGTIATANSISGSSLGISGTTVIDSSRNIGSVVNLAASGTITFSGLGAGIGHLSSGGVLTSSAVALGGSEITGTLGAGNGGTGQTTYAQGDLLYGNGGGTLSKLALGGPNQFLAAVAGNLIWEDVGGSINFWQRANGVLSPLAITDDLAVGGTATSSAKFQVFAPTGNATSSGNLTFDGASSIQTTKNQTLTIGGASTGNLVFSPQNGAGTVTVNGTMNLATGNVYQINGTSVLSNNTLGTGVTTSSLTTVGALASGSIASGFGSINIGASSLTAGGTITFSGLGAGIGHLSSGGVLTSSAVNLASSDITGTLGPTNGGTGLASYASGDIIYASATNTLSALAKGSNGQVLSLASGLPAWISTSSINFWQRANGAVAPLNITDDLLLGSTATGSARFAFTGVAGGTPTASLSAGVAGGAYLNATGTLATTANQTLTLGAAGTGNLAFAPGGNLAFTAFANGTIGIGTTNPLATLDIRGNSATTSIASISGSTNFAAAVIDQSGTGDIFTASRSGATRMTLTNAGELVLPMNGSTGGVLIGSDAQLYRSNTNILTLAGTRIINLNSSGGRVDITGSAAGWATGFFARGNLATDLGGFGFLGNADALTYYYIGPSSGSPYMTLRSGAVGIGTTTPLATLDVRGQSGTTPFASLSGTTAFAGAVIDQSGLGDIFAASKSGATKFLVNNSGNVQLAAGQTIDTLTSGTLGIGTTNATTLTLGRSGQGITLPSFNNCGMLTTSGTALTCTSAPITTTQYWQENLGAVTPANITDDLLLGATATGSAKFAFTGVAGGTPTASISAGVAGGVYLNATGTLATTANQTLTLGAAGTGNLAFAPGGSTAFTAFANGRIGVGTTNPLATLDIRGNSGTIPSASIAGQTSFAAAVIDQSGSGDIFTASISGLTKFTIKNNGDIAYGPAGANQTIVRNDPTNLNLLMGTTPTGANTGSYITAFGINAGRANTTGTSNSAFGASALLVNDTGSRNTGVGSIALGSNTGGTDNTAVGYGTLSFVNASFNTAVGSKALGGVSLTGVSNAALGYSALGANSSGTNNTALGTIALLSNTTGANNVALGYGAGYTITPGNANDSGSNNTYLGYLAGPNTPVQLSNAGAIGANSLVEASNNIIIGGLGANAVSVGIGTSSAIATFDVRGRLGTQPIASFSGQTAAAGLVIDQAGVGDLFTASKSGATKFVVKNNGDIALAAGQVIDTLTAGTLGIGITNATTLTIGRSGQGITLPGFNNCGMLTTSGTALTCSAAPSAGAQYWQENLGAVAPANITDDLLLGSTATGSAKFAFKNVAGGTPTASISANTTNNATFLTGDGTLSTTNAQTLTLGGTSTGNIVLSPAGGTGTVSSTGNLALATGKTFQITGSGDVLSASTLGTSVLTSSLTTVGILNAGSISSGFGAIDIGGDNLTAGGTVTFGGLSTGVVKSTSGVLSASAIGLATADVSGTLGVANGGTGTGTAFTQGSVVFAGASGVYTQNNANFFWDNTLKRFGIGVNANLLAALDIRATNGTAPVASVSGATAKSALVVDQSGVGDIVTASVSGATKFVITNAGDLALAAGAKIKPLTDSTTALNFTNAAGTTIAFLDTSASRLQVGSGAQNIGKFQVDGAVTGKALTVLNQTGDQSILVGSTSGTTKFVFDNSGNLSLAANSTFDTLAAGTLGIGTGNVTTLTLGKSSGTSIQLPSYGSANNSVLFADTTANGTLSKVAATSTGNLCLLSGAGTAAPSWGGCDTAPGVNLWQVLAGALSPKDSTSDMLLGGTATSSAKFAFTGVKTGTPTASISGSTANVATSLTGNGVLGTTNAQTLTLGNASTGNIVLAPGGVTALTAAGANLTGAGTFTSTGLLSANAGITVIGGTANINATGTGATSIGNGTGTVKLTLGSDAEGDIYYRNSSGNLARLAIGASNAFLTGGTDPSWTAGYVNDVTNTTLTRTGSGPYTLGLNLGNVNTWTGTQTYNAGATIANNSSLAVNSGSNITINSGANLNLAGASISSAVYTDGSRNLTTTAPTSGAIGYFTRTGTNLSPTTATDTLSLGTTSPLATLDIRGNSGTTPAASVSGTTAQAAFFVDNSGTGDLFTASKSGATKFTIENSGNILVGTNADTTDSHKLVIKATDHQLGLVNSSNNVWGIANWNGTNGLYYQYNSINQMYLGPTGSLELASNLAGASYSPLATLDVRANSGTTPVASVSGATAFAASVVDNSGVGDILTASKSGATKFTINNAGNVQINNLGQGAVLSSSTGLLSSGKIDLSSSSTYVTNTLGVGNGGTGQNSLTTNAVLVGAGSSAVSMVTGTTGQVLLSNAGVPTFTSFSGDISSVSNTGLVTIANLAITGTKVANNTLDFAQFKDSMTLDASTAVSLGGFTYTLGDNTGNGNVVVAPNAGGQAAFIINKLGANGDLLTASASGTTKFTVNNAGNVVAVGTIGASNFSGSSSGTNTGDITLNGAGQNYLSLSGQQITANAINLSGTNVTSTLGVGNGGTGTGTTFTQGSIVFAGASGVYTQNNANFFWDNTNNRLGIGANANLFAALDVRGTNATAPAASFSASTTNAAVIVDNKGTGDILTASSSGLTRFTVQQSGTVVIGNTTNGIVFDPTGTNLATLGVYRGTAQPTKQIILSSEYAGAVLTSSGSGTTNGVMTSDASPSATPTSFNFENYYMWSSTQNALQDYTVAVTVTLPKDFSAWPTSNAITIDYNTALTTSADNALDVYIYKKGDTSGVPVYFKTNNTSAGGNPKTWTTISISKAQLEGTTVLHTAGDQAVIYLKMKAMNTTNYVQVGDIKLNYLSMF